MNSEIYGEVKKGSQYSDRTVWEKMTSRGEWKELRSGELRYEWGECGIWYEELRPVNSEVWNCW